MQLQNIIAICIVIALAFVIDSTVKLYRYRRRNEISGRLRDLAILRRPNDFPIQEARLTFKNWIACGAMLVLVALFLLIGPLPAGDDSATMPTQVIAGKPITGDPATDKAATGETK